MRHVYTTQEHGELNIPLAMILDNGRLKIYPEVSTKGVLSVHLKRDRISLKANSWIGIIPINDEVAIEVQPRVLIRNLEELIWAVGGFQLESVPGLRTYSRSPIAIPSLVDLLACRLLDLVEDIRSVGLHFEYIRKVHVGPRVIGAIRPFQSVLVQRRTGNRQLAASVSWQRTVDTGPNRLLRLALVRLLGIYGGVRARDFSRKILSRLARADILLSRVSIDLQQTFWRHPLLVRGAEPFNARPNYSEAIELARLVLGGEGLAVRNAGGKVQLAPILLNMEDLFENFLRLSLQQFAEQHKLIVIDGNREHSSGFGRRDLYDFSNTNVGVSPKASPDILILRECDRRVVIIDVKYKPLRGLPDRSDVEQVVTYAVRYGVDRVALAYPHRAAGQPVAESVGRLGDIDISLLRFDLNTDSLAVEKGRFFEGLLHHLFS